MGVFLIMLGGVIFALAISGCIFEQIWLRRTEKKLTARHGEEIWKLDELAPEAFCNGKKSKQKKDGQG